MKFYRVNQRYIDEIRNIDNHVFVSKNAEGIVMEFNESLYFIPVEYRKTVRKSTPSILRIRYVNGGQLQCRLSSMIPVPYHELVAVTLDDHRQLMCLESNKQRIEKAMKRLYNQKNKGYDALYLENTVDFKKVEQFSIEFENKYYGRHLNRFPDESFFLVNPHTSGENEYYLMNKNKKVARIILNNETNSVKEIVEILNEDYAPLECFDGDKLTKEGITRWFKGRGIPSWRDGLDDFLENMGIQNKDVLLNKAFGLSLSDQYWMNPTLMMMNWEDINFFYHDFNSMDYIQSAFLGKVVDTNRVDFYTPNNTSDGMLKKNMDSRRWDKILVERLL